MGRSLGTPVCIRVCMCVCVGGDQANGYSLEGHLSWALGLRPPRSELGVEPKDGGSQAPTPRLLLFSGAPEGSLSSAWGCGHGRLGAVCAECHVAGGPGGCPAMACPAFGGRQGHAHFRLPQLCPSLRLTVNGVEGLSSTTVLKPCRCPPSWGPESSPQVRQR